MKIKENYLKYRQKAPKIKAFFEKTIDFCRQNNEGIIADHLANLTIPNENDRQESWKYIEK